MATQILVIFLIRTALPAWRSRPHPVLVTTSLAALAGALLLALSPLGHIFGFTAVPLPLLAVIAGLVAAYLILAEWLKRHAMGHARRHARRAHRS
jgi:Mg2+-importing ATPase